MALPLKNSDIIIAKMKCIAYIHRKDTYIQEDNGWQTVLLSQERRNTTISDIGGSRRYPTSSNINNVCKTDLTVVATPAFSSSGLPVHGPQESELAYHLVHSKD